jgi:tetratricopeptide (TPR) repeat protein
MDAYLRNRGLITRPNSDQVLTLLAWAYQRTGLSGRAAKLYEVLASRHPDNPDLALDLAHNRMSEGDYKGVIAALARPAAQKLGGDQAVEAASLRGRALSRNGQYGTAVEVLQPLLKKHPGHKMAYEDYLALGIALNRLGRSEDALPPLEMAEKMTRESKQAGMGLFRYLTAMETGAAASEAQRFPTAVEAYRRAAGAAKDNQDKAVATYELAQSLRGVGRNKEVADTFRKLKEMNVSPWSQMAARHLADMELAPRLAQVGK